MFPSSARGIVHAMTMNGRAVWIILLPLLYTALLLKSAGADDKALSPNSDGDETLFLMVFGESPEQESSDQLVLIHDIVIGCPASLEKEYIRSFASNLNIGDVMSLRELKASLALVEERLFRSNMFYTSKASYEYVTSTFDDDKPVPVTLIITTDEGFWWSFNFSPWDIMIGYNNIRGSGEKLEAVLGLNTQALAYQDPSIQYGPFFWNLEARHEVFLKDAGFDPDHLEEQASLTGGFGVALSDDLSLGLALGCRAFRSPYTYFLYPDYLPPPVSSLDELGLGHEYSLLFSSGLQIKCGDFNYGRRGGVRTSASLDLGILSSSSGLWSIVPRLSALGRLRFDAGRLLRFTLQERITYIPKTSSAGVPQSLWADVSELRCAAGLVSGEVASFSRFSLDLDRVASVGKGIFEFALIPELFYEFGAVSRKSYDTKMRFQQDLGFLVKAAASAPVNRTFAFGFAFGLEGESESHISFVIEVK